MLFGHSVLHGWTATAPGYGTENSQQQGQVEAAGPGPTFDQSGCSSASSGGLLVMSQTRTVCMLLSNNHV